MIKKTILQLVPSLISGGVERGVVEINNYLVKNNFNSIVVSSGGLLVYSIQQNGGKHINLNVNSKNPITIWKNIDKLRKIIRENNVDIVHVRSRAPAWSAYYACKRENCPLVSTIHGNYSVGSFLYSYFKKLYNSIMFKANWIICVSYFVKEHSLNNYKIFKDKFMENKAVIIPRGVDINIFNPDNISQERICSTITKLRIPDDKSIILLPGRFTEWKGQIYFLDVLEKLKNKNIICIMIGDDKGHKKYKEKLKNKILKKHLDEKVRLENNISDITALYSISDIIVSSSIRGEAFGRVIPEAQAMGRMAVATAIGGSLETVIDGETGWLVKLDDINAFADKIDYILNLSLEEKLKIGNQARKHINESYTTLQMCEKTLKLYNKIINNTDN